MHCSFVRDLFNPVSRSLLKGQEESVVSQFRYVHTRIYRLQPTYLPFLSHHKSITNKTQKHTQLASSAGATVISTSSSDTKLSIAKSLGATHLINYTTHPNWEEEVLRLTNGEGVDHVIENGGAQTLGQSLKCTKQGGLISIVGLLAGPFIPGENKIDVVTELLFGGKTCKYIIFFKIVLHSWLFRQFL